MPRPRNETLHESWQRQPQTRKTAASASERQKYTQGTEKTGLYRFHTKRSSEKKKENTSSEKRFFSSFCVCLQDAYIPCKRQS